MTSRRHLRAVPAPADDGREGHPIDFAPFVRLLQTTGAVALMHSELPATVVEFRAGLRRAARAAGIRVLSSNKEGSFVAWDPAFTVSNEALRAATDALALLPSTQPTCPIDRTVMRDTAEGWTCTTCGHQISLHPPVPLRRDIPRPAPPGIHGG